jgi:hypothetical protein
MKVTKPNYVELRNKVTSDGQVELGYRPATKAGVVSVILQEVWKLLMIPR